MIDELVPLGEHTIDIPSLSEWIAGWPWRSLPNWSKMLAVMGVSEPELVRDPRQGIASLGKWAAVSQPERDGPRRSTVGCVEGVPEPAPLRQGKRPLWGSFEHVIWQHAGFADSDLRSEWKLASRAAEKSDDPDAVWSQYLAKRQQIIERFEAKRRQLIERAEQAYERRLWNQRRRASRRKRRPTRR